MSDLIMQLPAAAADARSAGLQGGAFTCAGPFD